MRQRFFSAVMLRGAASRLAVLLVSVLLLWAGHRIVYVPRSYEGEDIPAYPARVAGIQRRDTSRYDMGDGEYLEETVVTFFARILDGPFKGDLVMSSQSSDPFYPIAQKEVAVGDKVLLHRVGGAEPGAADWQMGEYLRTDGVLALAGVFVLLMLLLGGSKGLWAVLALGLTCAAVFWVFVPALLSGRSIYAWTFVVCIFSIVSTLLLVSGFMEKSLAAAAGCAAGVGVSGVIVRVMDRVLLLTGYVDEHSLYLSALANGKLDLHGIMFAGILLGALGAVMDVTMSIASALWEIRLQNDQAGFGALMRSGLAIGRDVMGTMANTLVLAYIGSSLSMVLLLIAYSTSTLGLLNREMIVVESLQALAGSLGILCAIPLTSGVCAALYTRKKGTPPAVKETGT